MHITCAGCGKHFNILEERIKKFGDYVIFPCPACKGKVEVRLEDSMRVRSREERRAPEPEKGLPTGEALRKLIARTLSELPPMPQVAQKARSLLSNENATFNEFARVIETDQSIAMRVLKMANSPYYGQAGKVTSVQQAAAVLGMRTLNELLLLACSGSLMGSELQGYQMDSGDLWKHALATAECARLLAKQNFPGLADTAFTAGLIHDCGKLILDKYIFERQRYFEDFMNYGQRPFQEAEKQVFGFDHAEIAADVCEKWQMPKNIAATIKYHHSPASGSRGDLVKIVHAADAIALSSGIGAGIDSMMYDIDEAIMDLFSLNRSDIDRYINIAGEYVEKTA